MMSSSSTQSKCTRTPAIKVGRLRAEVPFLILFTLLLEPVFAQNKNAFSPNYHFKHSANLVADKNFYLLTAFQQEPVLRTLLLADTSLRAIYARRRNRVKQNAGDSIRSRSGLLTAFRWQGADSAASEAALTRLYEKNRKAFDQFLDTEIRPSGFYYNFCDSTNLSLLVKAWRQTEHGLNYIIDQFGLGKKMRYPRIDSASYPLRSRYYLVVLKDIFGYENETELQEGIFFEPSLRIAMRLMDANDRDEPAREEPMELRQNKEAVNRIARMHWDNYRYSAILIPGNGPELTTTPISPDNKIHCDLAALRFQQKLAPFIIVSGGYCYPFRGPYCEALEMKRYLMKKFAIPPGSIIIDPHARHTTTNIRNANRLIIRYGLPGSKPVDLVTSKSQTDYVNALAFDLRNQRELGYVPYVNKKRLSDHDTTYNLSYQSLHMDPGDPLDP